MQLVEPRQRGVDGIAQTSKRKKDDTNPGPLDRESCVLMKMLSAVHVPT